jgi:hypothetical protein
VPNQKKVVEQGLELLIRRSQQQIRKLRGRVQWEGDLDELRGGKRYRSSSPGAMD